MLLEGSWKMIVSWIMFGMFGLGAFVWMVLGWLKGISETSVESEKGYGNVDAVSQTVKMMKEEGIKELEVSSDKFRVVLGRNKMPPKGKCRVCGAPAPGNMPCYKCCNLLLDRDNENMEADVRIKASEELEKRSRMKSGQ